MATQALAISRADLRPLIQDPTSIDGAMAAIERATIDFHRGLARENNLADQTQGTERPNTLQVHLSADDEYVSGFQFFAEDRGGPERDNARFVAVLDPKTRELLALVDYWSLSPIRVGASAGVGCRYLAPEGSKTVAILGSSKQAKGELWAIRRAVPSLERARVFSPNAEHRESFAREMTQFLGFPVEAASSAQEAVEGADVVGLANSSREPVLEMSWLRAGALVATISGPNQLPSEIANVAHFVAPNAAPVLEREPYASRVKDGIPASDIVTPLGAVILNEGAVRKTPDQLVVFEVSRLNLWAIAVAEWAHQWARTNKVGTSFTLGG